MTKYSDRNVVRRWHRPISDYEKSGTSSRSSCTVPTELACVQGHCQTTAP
jgi:hypothetical protein